MTPFIQTLIQWGVNLAVLAFVGLGKWGMTQRERAGKAEITALTERIATLEKQRQEKEAVCMRHQADINDFRNRTEQVEGYMKRVTEDFATALRQMEKMTERIDNIKDNMLRRQDLDLITKINQG